MDDVFAALARLLDDSGVSYALIGGHAVNAWLEPRFTADIDITVQADVDGIERLKHRLEREGYVLEREHGGELASGPDFLRFVARDETTLEVQTAKTQFQSAVIKRSEVTKGSMRVATPEDLIIMKLIAGRTKDKLDLVGLVTLPDLDWAYVEHLAVEWDLVNELAAVRAQG